MTVSSTPYSTHEISHVALLASSEMLIFCYGSAYFTQLRTSSQEILDLGFPVPILPHFEERVGADDKTDLHTLADALFFTERKQCEASFILTSFCTVELIHLLIFTRKFSSVWVLGYLNSTEVTDQASGLAA